MGICLIAATAFAAADLESHLRKRWDFAVYYRTEKEISQEIALTGNGLLENCRYSQSCEDRLLKELKLTSNVSKALKELLGKLNYMSDIDSKHRVTFALEEIDKIIHECNATIKSVATVEKQKITLHYSLKGPNSQKNAQYDRNALASIVEASVRAGVDPYLAMAIVVMEMTSFQRYGEL